MFAVWVGGVAGEGGKGMSLNAATAMKLRAIAIVVSYGGNQDKGQEKRGAKQEYRKLVLPLLVVLVC